MKVRELIARLKKLDPDTEIAGTDELHVRASLFGEEMDEALDEPPKTFLRGQNREDCINDKRPVAEVAKSYGVSEAYVIKIQKERKAK